jgi:hypothetical protein
MSFTEFEVDDAVWVPPEASSACTGTGCVETEKRKDIVFRLRHIHCCRAVNYLGNFCHEPSKSYNKLFLTDMPVQVPEFVLA